MTKIVDYLAIYDLGDEESAWQAKWLKRFLPLAAGSAILLFALQLRELRQDLAALRLGFVLLVFWLGNCAGAGWFLWRGMVQKASLWTTGLLYTASCFTLFTFFGLGSAITAAFFVLIVLVSVFVGKRLVWPFAVATAIVVVVQFTVEQAGLVRPMTDYVAPIVNVGIFLASFAIFVRLLTATIQRLDDQLEKMRQSEERYRTLFEYSPIAIWEQDATAVNAYLKKIRESGVTDFRAHFLQHPEVVLECIRLMRVLDVNETAVQMYRAADKQDLLENVERLVPADAYDFIIDSLVAVANQESSFTREIRNRLQDGSEIDILYRWVVSPYWLPTMQKVFTSVVDISQQKAAEAAQRRYAERLQALHQLDLAVLSMQTPMAAAQTALRHLQLLVPFDQAGVALFDETSKRASLIATAGTKSFFQDETGVGYPEFLDSLRRGQHYLYLNMEAVAAGPIMERYVSLGARSLLLVPLNVQQELLGALVLVDVDADAFSEDHVSIVREIAAPLAIGLHNAKLLEAEQLARHRAEMLRQSSMELNRSLEKSGVLELILSQLTRLITADSVSIMLMGEQGLSLAAHKGYKTDAILHASGNGHTWKSLYRVVQKQEPIYVPDTSQDPDWQTNPESESIRSWIGVPLEAQGELLGLININSRMPNCYSTEDVDWAAAFAHQAGLALENARLYEDIQRYANEMERRVAERTRELSALYDVTAVAAENQSLDTILDKAMMRTMDALKCRAGVIHIWQSSPGHFERTAAKGISGELLNFLEAQPEADSLMHYVMATSQPILASPFTAPSLPPVTNWQPFNTYMGAPMRSTGQIYGVLSVLAAESQYFSVEDVALLDSIADQIGLTIENARLQQQAHQLAVIEERNRLSRDMHDSVTQSLYSLTLFAAAAQEHAQAEQLEMVQDYMQTMMSAAQQALKEMRLLLYELRQSDREPMNLVDELRHRLEMVEKRARVDCTFDVGDLGTLPPEVQNAYHLVAQEALNNILKHAGATAVSIRLYREQGVLTMKIEDNGCGFDEHFAAGSGGMGLITMRERIGQLGGEVTIRSRPGTGTTVLVESHVGAAAS